MLAEHLRVLIDHLFERLAEHSPLRRYNQSTGHFDVHFIAADVLRGHAPWEPVLTGAKEHRVLDLGPLYAIIIAPFEEYIKFLLHFLDFGIIEPISVTFACFDLFCHAFDRVKELQEAELRFYLHFRFGQPILNFLK